MKNKVSETPIWDLVIEDMRQRDQTGRERYGRQLHISNGRDALKDAYEEALDLAVYMRQVIEERKTYLIFLDETIRILESLNFGCEQFKKSREAYLKITSTVDVK